MFETPGSGSRVSPGAANTAATRPFLDALEARTDLIAGQPAWFTVAVKDAPGNVRFVERDLAGGVGTWGSLTVTQIDANANPRGPGAVIFRGVDAVMDNVTGAHNVSFTPTVAGKIRVSVRVESDGSFLYADAPVRSNSVSASASEVFGVGADAGSAAGKPRTFTCSCATPSATPPRSKPASVFG